MNYSRTWPSVWACCLLLVLGACDASSDDPKERSSEPDSDDPKTRSDAAERGPDGAAERADHTKVDAGKMPVHDAASERDDTKIDAASVDASTGSGDAGLSSPHDASTARPDAKSYAGKLDGLFFDVKCAPGTPMQLAEMATCQHPPAGQRVEQKIVFGGAQGTTYDVKLRVRGIWEPTSIQGGTRPLGKTPFTLGGTVATGAGDPINYQQYFIEVSEPKQTYWLNDYQYVAHDIHKEDYEAPLRIAAGATVTVVMNDGNDREIANWTKDYFDGLEPYEKAPSTGQLLRLDVLSVSPR